MGPDITAESTGLLRRKPPIVTPTRIPNIPRRVMSFSSSLSGLHLDKRRAQPSKEDPAKLPPPMIEMETRRAIVPSS
jgi:hypothetical protein